VGYIINHDLTDFFAELLEGGALEKTAPFLEYFVKIRAVQEFSPSQAVSFVFLLKKAVRENLKEEIQAGKICGELLDFESRLDQAALLIFEYYTRNREKIHEIRTRQIRSGPFKRFERGLPSNGSGTKEEVGNDDEN
jgi:hypothetical protein